MENKKYLKWYQKLAYGTGDMGSNFMYALVSSFILLYLTTAMGMNAAIVGTLMMVSKILDGITDVFFGGLIDKTHSKMGKARPWMFWSTFLLAISEILLFSVPQAAPTLQYVYFFVVYTLLNAGFYTANNIAYAALTALITKNPTERVQLGSIRFVFALITNIIIASITVGLVENFGGGPAGWRTVAIIYALLLTVFNTIAVLAVKEIPEEENADQLNAVTADKRSLWDNFKLLVRNKYYLLILAYYIVFYASSGIGSGIGVFYCTYTLGSAEVLGLISMVGMVPMVVGLLITPALVSKFGIYKVNLWGMIISVAASIPSAIFGYSGKLVPYLAFAAISSLGGAPMLGTLNAVIAETATYSYNKDGVHLDGTMFSCSSMGIKLGGGIGTALGGWLLAAGGFDGAAAVQSASAISMINFMYLMIPVILGIVKLILVARLDVEKANKQLLASKETAETAQ